VTHPRVTIYTDGACDPNPGPGGWSAILRFGSTEKVLTGGERKTTNNRMELTAALRALETLTEPCRVEIYTDSEYLQRGITEWMPDWKARNWKRKGGKLANLDLWQALDAALVRHAVDWNWVRGHAGVRHNQRADALARKAILR
jgi:ribonuclease HI